MYSNVVACACVQRNVVYTPAIIFEKRRDGGEGEDKERVDFYKWHIHHVVREVATFRFCVNRNAHAYDRRDLAEPRPLSLATPPYRCSLFSV